MFEAWRAYSAPSELAVLRSFSSINVWSLTGPTTNQYRFLPLQTFDTATTLLLHHFFWHRLCSLKHLCYACAESERK
jgi:hypothetical protein